MKNEQIVERLKDRKDLRQSLIAKRENLEKKIFAVEQEIAKLHGN